ncbi:MAG TPA: hypothetical protein VKX25_01540 [Bryobacteraceae bacterium]|jgi:hypothetical protein|nr:hypothetical protein [Bryobacteraceae bacterium]
MSEYDLRSAFPLNDKEFVVHDKRWICRLAEVSDQRPQLDRLSWYLVFESDKPGGKSEPEEIRKLEIVTPATEILEQGWGDDLPDRLVEWLMTNEQDGRVEWFTEEEE